MKDKYYIIIGCTIAIIVMIILCYMFAKDINLNPYKYSSQDDYIKKHDIHIAIVNEDKQYNYNGKNLELGKLFLNRLAKKDEHDFQTVSRASAENGLKNGQYQVMIIIPKDFSKSSMQLDSKNPTKAKILYKTATGVKENTAKEIEKTVANFLTEFNKDLIQIYFGSIIDNLHNAQNNVDEMVSRRNKDNDTFSDYLLDPLNDYSGKFTNINSETTKANNNLTKWIQNFNRTLQGYNPFKFDTSISATDLINNQSDLFNEKESALDQLLNENSKKDKQLDEYINKLKLINKSLQDNSSNLVSEEDFKKEFNRRIDHLDKSIDKNKKPFTKEMLEKYRKNLRASLENNNNEENNLNQAMKQIEKNNKNIHSKLETSLINSITQSDKSNDNEYITSLTKQDLINTGLSSDKEKVYQEKLQHVYDFIKSYNKSHKDQPIQQVKYNDELRGGDTSQLENKGVYIQQERTIKAKTLNQLQIALDSRFKYQGKITVNDTEFELKNSAIKLSSNNSTFKVKVEGQAYLKEDQRNDFINDPTLYTQLFIGELKAQNNQVINNGFANVIDISFEKNLQNDILSPQLSRQLKSLDQFETQYKIYNSIKGSLNTEDQRDALIDLVINNISQDMNDYDSDKDKIHNSLKDIKMYPKQYVDKVIKNSNKTTKLTQNLDEILSQLEENKDNKVNTNKLDVKKDEKNHFVELSTKLDDNVRKLSSESSKVLADSKTSKENAQAVERNLNNVDQQMNDLNATSRSLGKKANDLNKDMMSHKAKDENFSNNFKDVLKNAKQGEKQNGNLKEYLSNPVTQKNLENVYNHNGDKAVLSPTIYITLLYICTTILAYIVSSYERIKGIPEIIDNEFSKHNLIWNKLLFITILLASSLALSLIFGLIGLRYFGIYAGFKFKFLLLTILVVVLFSLLNTYLLRQLRSIGFVFIMIIFGIYMCCINTLSTKVNHMIIFSPLNYIDAVFYRFLNQEISLVKPIILLFMMIVLAFIANIFVFRKRPLI